jgi:hypothetical protein
MYLRNVDSTAHIQKVQRPKSRISIIFNELAGVAVTLLDSN